MLDRKEPELRLATDSYNVLTPFHLVAQDLINRYYLRPYHDNTSDSDSDSEKTIERHFHGGLHAASTVCNHRLFFSLLEKHIPHPRDIIRNLNGDAAPNELDNLLLAYAVLCHDIGNTAEEESDETHHAIIYSREMKSLGFPEEKIAVYAKAIINKDRKDWDNKTLAEMVIHDADCWEITRVLDDNSFDIEELDIVKLFRKHLSGTALENALQEVRAIAEFYESLVYFLYQDEIHQRCEFASNCYLTTQRYIQSFRAHSIYYRDFCRDARYEPIAFDAATIPKIHQGHYYKDALELYRYGLDKHTFSVLPQFLGELKSGYEAERLYRQGQPLFIRTLIGSISDELEVLKENRCALKAANITTSAELRTYFLRMREHGLRGFKFRPMTLVTSRIPISLCVHTDPQGYVGEHPPGVILHPDYVLAAFCYKYDVFSCDIVHDGTYDLHKEQHSLQNFIQKLNDWEMRRCGLTFDYKNRCYGRSTFSYNEVLASYHYQNAIIGILSGEAPSTARDALYLRNRLHILAKKSVPFYHYSPLRGIEAVSDEAVLQLASLSKAEDEKEQLTLPIEKMQKWSIQYRDEEQKLYKEFSNCVKQTVHPLQTACSLSEKLPSKAAPITYSFLMKELNVKGSGFIYGGIPVIKLNGTRFFDSSNLLLQIANIHQNNLLKKCNELAKSLTPLLKEEFQIEELRFKGCDYDEITLIPSPFLGYADIHSLLSWIGYPSHLKSQIHAVNPDSVASSYNAILFVRQAIDLIYGRLSQRLSEWRHTLHSKSESSTIVVKEGTHKHSRGLDTVPAEEHRMKRLKSPN